MNPQAFIAVFREMAELKQNLQLLREKVKEYEISLALLEKNIDNVYSGFYEAFRDQIRLSDNNQFQRNLNGNSVSDSV